MKIDCIEVHLLRVPFDMGAAPTAFGGMNWKSVDSLFVRVRTDEGIDGWGEGWGHAACPVTRTAIAELVGPAFIGCDAADRLGLMDRMARRFHLHGRTGAAVHALSAIEIALWDIAGKAAGQPVAQLLGGTPRELDCYASLLRYAEPPLVGQAVERALAQGFRHLKLHEDTVEAVRAAREVATMLAAGAVDICQPSVIKFGGIEAVRQAATLIRASGAEYVPHCFYFGPGYLASLHLAAALAPDVPFEVFYGKLEASPYHDLVLKQTGRVQAPSGPGLGLEPDLSVIDRFRLGEPIVIR